jgi:hypothetical protein
MPQSIAALPRDHRGYPVPWFVAWRDGVAVFPAFDPDKWNRAVNRRLCWVCGEPLGRAMVFVVGPMCTINRISSEPPCHFVCASYSAQVCPFLANPQMRRVPEEITGPVSAPGGIMATHNPGVMALWSTRHYRIIRTDTGPIVGMGPASSVRWWTRGRLATAREAEEAFLIGVARLSEMAKPDGLEAISALARMASEAGRWLPAPDLPR